MKNIIAFILAFSAFCTESYGQADSTRKWKPFVSSSFGVTHENLWGNSQWHFPTLGVLGGYSRRLNAFLDLNLGTGVTLQNRKENFDGFC